MFLYPPRVCTVTEEYAVASVQGDVSKHFQAEIKAVFIYITMSSMSISWPRVRGGL